MLAPRALEAAVASIPELPRAGFEEIRVCSLGPLHIELSLHTGFLRIDSGIGWVSDNSLHRKLSFREDLLSAIE
jgi:hypothetical protein